MTARVLIADDSAVLRGALRALFKGLGDYEIVEAATGTEAVEKAEESRPDLIILDFAMPVMDGLSASRLLQKRLPEIPVLMYTMHSTDQLHAHARTAGVRRLISKCDTSDLVAAINEVTASSQTAMRPASVRAVGASRREGAALRMPAARTGS